jgi:hypothetical protein
MDKISAVKKNVMYFILACLALFYFLLNLGNLINSISSGIVFSGDITQDYVGAKQLLKGRNIFNFSESEIREALTPVDTDKLIVVRGNIKNLKNVHPPITIIMLLPLSFLNFRDCRIIWTIITFVLIFIMAVLLTSNEKIPWKYFPLMIIFLISWPPFQRNVECGNVQILLSFFVFLVFYFSSKNQKLEGIFAGIATMMKFYPGLLLAYYLLINKKRPLLTALITIILIVIISILITKYDFIRLFTTIIPSDVRIYQDSYENQNFNGIYSDLFIPLSSNFSGFVLIPSPFLKYFFLIITIAIFAVIIYKFRKVLVANEKLGMSLFVVLSLLFSPLIFDHSHTLLIYPLLIVFLNLKTLKEKIIFTVSFLLLIMPIKPSILKPLILLGQKILFGFKNSPAEIFLFYSFRFYGLIILFILILILLKRNVLETEKLMKAS